MRSLPSLVDAQNVWPNIDAGLFMKAEGKTRVTVWAGTKQTIASNRSRRMLPVALKKPGSSVGARYTRATKAHCAGCLERPTRSGEKKLSQRRIEFSLEDLSCRRGKEKTGSSSCSLVNPPNRLAR